VKCTSCCKELVWTEKVNRCKQCQNVYLCNGCLLTYRNENHTNSHTFWVVKYPEESFFNTKMGENPRGASYDVRSPCCFHGCRGINWKCTECYGFDVCEPCERLEDGHQKSHALIRIYSCNFETYSKWDWFSTENSQDSLPLRKLYNEPMSKV